MLDWRTILCGVDGSEESLRAVKLAASIAERLSARLLGLYVIPAHLVYQLGIYRAEGEAELTADAEALLTGIRDQTGFPIEPLILQGDPADTLIEVAAERSCDLLVAGHRGRSGVARWFLGNVATKIVFHAASTVLVSKGQAPTLCARTLCGLDGSPESERAAMEALGLVELLGGSIRFAHVRSSDQEAGSADTLLASYCEKARKAGVTADPVAIEGQPAAAILGLAADWDANLIAVGNRGLGGFAGLRLGSTSHQILQHALCSVLICPGKPVAE